VAAQEPGTQAELAAAWRAEARAPFAGWDFSHLDGRMVEEPTPWSYEQLAAALLPGSGAAVDTDTGGGERFAELRPRWPRLAVATEGHAPNARLAAERLRPLGAWVVPMPSSENTPMPFVDGAFGLVLNRHGAFNAAEVGRVLRAGGVFLTQQVHGQWAADLLAEFGASPRWPDASPERYLPRLEAAGLAIEDVRDRTGRLTFSDVGALAYFLANVPWLVPGFTVDRHLDRLWRLHERVVAEGQLVFTARHYLLRAVKPDRPTPVSRR
jgi:SAM-dependent methyltransferase